MSARILIVDDEVRHRELYSKVLAQAGFETAVAASFQEALGMIRKAVPVLVVSDVRMPGADGIQLLRMVRDAYPAIPFLLVTAYA